MNKLVELAEKRINRRKFLTGAGAAGAATALAGCASTGVNPGPTVAYGYTDSDIFNFALNLEYLEAEFYLYAATGQGLSSAYNDVGGAPGTTIGGAKITGLSTAQQNILNEIAFDEQAHVRLLRSILSSGTSGASTSAPLGGNSAISRPNIDLTNSFNALAAAANIPGGTLNPFQDFDHFLLGAFIFEDVGVTAYTGAAPLFSTPGSLGIAPPSGSSGTANFLSGAAAILAVEAYHAAYIRTTLTANALTIPNYPYLGYANQISTVRATLGGGNETPLTVPTGTPAAPTPTTIVPATTANAIAFARTTDQVMHIVYGKTGAGVSSGGFFPSGLNGNITVTQS